MRVLYIASGDSKYGASRSMVEMMLYMKRYYNVEPVILTRKRNPLNQMCDELGIENYSFWNRDIMAGSAYNSWILNAMKHFVKYFLFVRGGLSQSGISKIGLDFSNIDLIHSNLNRNDIGAYIARKYNIPHIWHLRELGKEDYRVRYYKRNCITYMNKNADAFIAISNCVKAAWVSKGLEEEKIQTIYNGIDLEKFIDKKPHINNKVRIVMSGHIQLTKGQDQLVRAIAELDMKYRERIQVDFYGEAYPDYQKKLKKIIKDYNLEGIIRFCGYSNNIPKLLSEYDIGIICSKAEGFGRVTVEYMAAGLTVIGSNTGANVELIHHEENGLLYQYGNPKDLALKIQSLLDNEEKREKLAQNGKRCIEKFYTTERNVQEIYNVYLKTLEN